MAHVVDGAWCSSLPGYRPRWRSLRSELPPKAIHRILRPGGIFGFVELSRPEDPRRRRWMDRYLSSMAPALSTLLGADPQAPLLLREYITRFDNAHLLLPSFYKHRCVFYRYEFFGGCATAIVGMKDTT